VSDVNVDVPISNSDHCRVDFCVTVETPTRVYEIQQVKQYMWDKADYNRLSSCLSAVDWSFLLSVNLTTDQLWSAFCHELDVAIDQCVPFRYVNTQQKSCRKKSYPAKIRAAIARKRCLWRSCRSRPSNNDLIEKYHRAQDKCKHLIHAYELKKEQEVVHTKNLGRFLADRTIGRAYGTVCRLSVCLSVCL